MGKSFFLCLGIDFYFVFGVRVLGVVFVQKVFCFFFGVSNIYDLPSKFIFFLYQVVHFRFFEEVEHGLYSFVTSGG